MRKPRINDAPQVFEYSSDPEATKFIKWKPHKNMEASKNFIKDCLKEWKENTNRGWFTWLITTKKSDKAIGNISLKLAGRKANFAYILSRKKWGKGYMSEALAAIIEVAQKIPDVKVIWGSCDAKNKASAHVMKKAGLKSVNNKIFILKKRDNRT